MLLVQAGGPKMRSIYGVYDTKEDGLCIGIFKGAKAVAKQFNMQQESVYACVTRGTRIKQRYEIKKLKLWEER